MPADKRGPGMQSRRRQIWAFVLAGLILAVGLFRSGAETWSGHPRLVENVVASGRMVCALAITVACVASWWRNRHAR